MKRAVRLTIIRFLVAAIIIFALVKLEQWSSKSGGFGGMMILIVLIFLAGFFMLFSGWLSKRKK